ncbi:hypothetical protein HYFRA_00004531 [Hymenoscyphus fraxineus]|uniref:Uncharacterized protein n=1 Tax=Hymenoscyphus fraxineus TaxID=746836 RepID=A0A9N9L048_9HELO|nr:hypothetical protein HYFRA_00004531 [Hymenoscyphus fraxineus]
MSRSPSTSSWVEVPKENDSSPPVPASSPPVPASSPPALATSPVRSRAPSPPSRTSSVEPSENRAPSPTASQHAPSPPSSPPVVQPGSRNASPGSPLSSPIPPQYLSPGSPLLSPNPAAMSFSSSSVSNMDNNGDTVTQEARRAHPLRRPRRGAFHRNACEGSPICTRPGGSCQVVSNPARHARRASPQVSPRSTVPQRGPWFPIDRMSAFPNFLAVRIEYLLPVFGIPGRKVARAIERGLLPVYENPERDDSLAVPVDALPPVFGISPYEIHDAISLGRLPVFDSNPWADGIYQEPIIDLLETVPLMILMSTGQPFTTLELIGARRESHGDEPMDVFLGWLNDELWTGRIVDLGNGLFQYNINHPTLWHSDNLEEEVMDDMDHYMGDDEDEGYYEQCCECANSALPSDNYIVHPDWTVDVLEREGRQSFYQGFRCY